MFMSGYDRRNIFKNIVLYLCVSALFILPISTLLTSLPAFAAGYFDSLSIQEKYKFYVYARVIDKCLSKWPGYHPNVHNGNIFSSGKVYVGTFPEFTGQGYNESEGSFDCSSKELLSEAVNKFGIKPVERATAAETLFCYMGYKRASQTTGPNEKKSANDYIPKGDSCTSGTGEELYHPDGYKEGKIFELLSEISGYKKGSENSDPGIKYLVSRSMIKGCIKDGKPQSRRLNPKDWEIPDVDGNGNLTKSYYLPGDGQGYNVDGSRNREWPQDSYDAKIPEWQCMNIYQRLVESAPKYQEALKQSATDTACAGLAGDKLKACKDGVNHKGDSTYCGTTYENTEDINACKQGQSAKIEAPEEEEGGEPKNSCGIDGGLGWLICPVMTFVANINDAAYGAISGFLDIKPAILSSGDNSGAKQGWDFFRNIANAIFAVIFLWIIFSQISNVGVSNYGIKKILPRLIIGALLVNLSYYLCQIFVDLSNILGHTLKDALEAGAGDIGTTSEAAGWGSVIAAAIVGVGGVAAFAALAIGIPTLAAGFLAIMTVFIILVVRQAGIILLISMSPIAFAAWLLPNTEDLFKKWMKMFRGLLLVFPIISLLYGAGKLAGAVLASSATVDPNNPDETLHLVALAATTMPLIATPFVLQNSLSSLGSIGAKIGKLSSAANGNLKNAVMNKSRISDVKNAWKSRSARKLAERRSGNTWYGRTASNLRDRNNSMLKRGLGVAMNPAAALDDSWVGRKIGLSSGAGAAQEAYDKAAMEKAERAITYQYGGDAEKALKDKKADKYTRIAAVNQLKGQGSHGADVVANYLRDGGEVDSVSMANALTEMKGSHAGVSEAGVKALKDLQSGQSSFSLGQKDSSGNVIGDSAKDEFNSLTKDGVRKLSNEAIAKQNADAIKHSAIKRNDALKLLKDDRLRSMMSQDTKNALVNK
jgi:TRAP-type C4-dicarboxylate transport system, large permease component